MTPQERTELKHLVDAARRVRAKREEYLDRALARERKDPTHGTVAAYMYHRCRCEPCRSAHSLFLKKRRAK